MSGILSVPSPSMLAYYSDYVLCASSLKLNIFRPVAMSEYIVFSVISFLTTTRDARTAMAECYGLVPYSIESGVLV